MANEQTIARPDREQTKAMFRERILDVMARKIATATPNQVRALAAEMFALIELHGWRFVTRAEQDAAADVETGT